MAKRSRIAIVAAASLFALVVDYGARLSAQVSPDAATTRDAAPAGTGGEVGRQTAQTSSDAAIAPVAAPAAAQAGSGEAATQAAPSEAVIVIEAPPPLARAPQPSTPENAVPSGIRRRVFSLPILVLGLSEPRWPPPKSVFPAKPSGTKSVAGSDALATDAAAKSPATALSSAAAALPVAPTRTTATTQPITPIASKTVTQSPSAGSPAGSPSTSATLSNPTLAPKPETAKAVVPRASSSGSAAPTANTAAKADVSTAIAPKASPTKSSAASPVASKPGSATNAATGISPGPLSSALLFDPQARASEPRLALAEAGSRFEIPFEGTGWTYLGEKDGKEGILYDTRRFEGKGVLFSLVAGKPGEYLLRFQRQDAMRGVAYDEYVAVTVRPRETATPATGSRPVAATATGSAASAGTIASLGTAPASGTTRATAPSSITAAQPVATSSTADAQDAANASSSAATSQPSAGAQASARASTSSTAAAQPVVGLQGEFSALRLPPDSPEGLLSAARSELAAGRVRGVLDSLDRFLEARPEGMDEVFFLYAKALEHEGPLRDIRGAYGNYKRVRDEYPQSRFWDEAAQKTSYIERYYLEIR